MNIKSWVRIPPTGALMIYSGMAELVDAVDCSNGHLKK